MFIQYLLLSKAPYSTCKKHSMFYHYLCSRWGIKPISWCHKHLYKIISLCVFVQMVTVLI